MIPEITIGAASVTGALVVAVGFARWWVSPIKPPGRHSAEGLMFRPCDVADNRRAYCLVQQRHTDHAVLPGNLLICWECRNRSIVPPAASAIQGEQ